MIRFIDMGKQYWGGLDVEDSDHCREEFAFIDTVTDRFVDVGGNRYWDCWDDFAEDYNSAGWDDKVRGGKMELSRFKALIDKKFIRDSTYE